MEDRIEMSSLKNIEAMSDDEVIAGIRRETEHLQPNFNYYFNEYVRRGQDRQAQAMLDYTKWITIMTGVVTLATIVNVGIAAATFLMAAGVLPPSVPTAR